MRFVSKADDYQVYGALLLEVMTNQKMRASPACKTYLAFANGAASPKKARKFKKPASPSRKRKLVTVEEEEPEPAKKVVPSKKSTSVQIRDTPIVYVLKKKAPATTEISKGIDLLFEATLLEEDQVKKVLKRSRRETTSHQAGGSGDGTGSKPGSDEANVQGDDKDVLENTELADKEKGNKEMTNAETVNSEHVEGSQEVARDQVKDDARETVTTALDAQKTKVPLQSSSISFDYASPATTISSLLLSLFPNLQQSTPIPTPTNTKDTTSTPTILEFETLNAIYLRVLELEKEVKELKNVDHSSSLLAIIRSEVPTIVKEYLGTNLDDALHKVLQRHTADIKMEQAKKQPESKYTIRSSDKTALAEFDMKKALFDSMHASKSFNKTPKNKNLYHALMESLIKDENAMDQRVADLIKQKKRPYYDAGKDEGPPTRSDQGLKRQKQAKTLNHQRRPCQLEFPKEPPNLSQNLLANDMGNTDEPPVVNVYPKDCFKKPKSPPTPDPEWNEGKSFDNKPTQKWLSDLAKEEKSSKRFNELMSTPIDINIFVMKCLHFSELTQDILVGPAYNILKGTCRGFVKLEYNMEECLKALTDQLDWNNPQGDRYAFVTPPFLQYSNGS
ncbi:hypothetical protein Tco_0169574 [Tanacetum coccineum]